MPTKYLSAAETAALVRQALREAFRGAKFSVRIKTYRGGASARVCWTDGPSYTQIERITAPFKGSNALDRRTVRIAQQQEFAWT